MKAFLRVNRLESAPHNIQSCSNKRSTSSFGLYRAKALLDMLAFCKPCRIICTSAAA